MVVHKELCEALQPLMDAKIVTSKEIFDTVYSNLKRIFPEVKAIDEILDYAISSSCEMVEVDLSKVADSSITLSPGSCEGIYVDWSLLARGKDSDMELHIATFKTLDEDVNAYAKMGALTGYLSYASDLLIG